MGAYSGIYDSEFIQPIAKIKENLAIWTVGKWLYYTIQYLEPLPPGPASTVDTVALQLAAGGAAAIAANGTINKLATTVLQMQSGDFLHCRWEPLDNVEGLLWEQAGQQRFMTKNIHARTDRRVRLWDYNLVTTTFGIIGTNRDISLETRNPTAYALPSARFVFFGYRYVIEEIAAAKCPSNPTQQRALDVGDAKTVRDVIGAVTYFPAEGRQS